MVNGLLHEDYENVLNAHKIYEPKKCRNWEKKKKQYDMVKKQKK